MSPDIREYSRGRCLAGDLCSLHLPEVLLGLLADLWIDYVYREWLVRVQSIDIILAILIGAPHGAICHWHRLSTSEHEIIGVS